MSKLLRILGLKAEEKELNKKLENQKNQGQDTSETKLDISCNFLLQYSAKTKKDE